MPIVDLRAVRGGRFELPRAFNHPSHQALTRRRSGVHRMFQVAFAVSAIALGPCYAQASSDSGAPGAEPALDRGPPAQPRLSKEEVETVLPLFLKFAETRQLAASLEASIKQGDMIAAKALIEKAVEASTFAVLASDWLQDPVLVRMLHQHGMRGAAPAAPNGTAELLELKKALEVEREGRELARREYAALAEQLSALQRSRDDHAAAVAEMSGLRDALQREQARIRHFESESALAAAELAKAEVDRGRVEAELQGVRQALDRERERSGALARDHAAANERLSTLQLYEERHAAAMAEVGELRRTLEVERERSLSLAREYAALGQRLAAVQFTHSVGGNEQLAQGRRTTTGPELASPPADIRIRPKASTNPLVSRAEALLRGGDVSGARLLLERAADVGDAEAFFVLAETFDPSVLSRLGVIGIRGDLQKAEDLYARARILRERQAMGPVGAAQ